MPLIVVVVMMVLTLRNQSGLVHQLQMYLVWINRVSHQEISRQEIMVLHLGEINLDYHQIDNTCYRLLDMITIYIGCGILM